MASQKPDLSKLQSKLSNTATTPRKAPQETKPEPAHAREEKDRGVPITFHMPNPVRKQLKGLALQCDTTVHNLGAEAFNDLFAKYGKPEIAPITKKHDKG
jgi:hypothetical protein